MVKSDNNLFVRINSKLRTSPIFFNRNCTFYYICFIFFIWYSNHPNIFERIFYFNELLSVIGFVLFLANPIVYKKDDRLYNTIISILCVFSAYAVYSLFIFENSYGYLRNSVLLYSIFSFFLGIRLYESLVMIGKGDILILGALTPSISFYRASYAASLPYYMSRYLRSYNIFSILIIILIILMVRAYYGGFSSIAVIFSILYFYFITKRIKRITLFLLCVLGVSFLIVIKPYLYMLLTDNKMKINILQQMYPIFGIDSGVTVRILIWAYLFYEVFLDNLFGIGLGTKLIPKTFLWDKLDMRIGDPYVEYTLGAHNSFFTILLRFGLIGLIPFIYLYWHLIDEFIKDKSNSNGHRLMFCYYAFYIISACAMVNVVIESPIHSSCYWGTLGILYQAKKCYSEKNIYDAAA